MRFEAFAALRFLRAKRRSRMVNFVAIVAVTGVAVGVMALVVVTAVLTGFDLQLRDSIIGNRSHLIITDYRGERFDDPQSVAREVEALCPEAQAWAPFIESKALLAIPASSASVRKQCTAFIRGIDPERESKVTQLGDNVTNKDGRIRGSGKLPGDREIVLGYLLAEKLGAHVGDTIVASTIREGAGATGLSRERVSLKVSGIAQARMYEFDLIYGWVTLETAALLTGGVGVDGFEFKLSEPFKTANIVRDRVRQRLGLRAETWYDTQEDLFLQLRQEKVIIFIIISGIVVVAAFNVTSTLIMMVMEKRQDIGILRTIGMSAGGILRLFVIQGLLIGLFGTLGGIAAGGLCAHELVHIGEMAAKFLGLGALSAETYHFDHLPVAVTAFDVAWIAISSVLLTFLSTLYPAWNAARLDPVECLRYE